MTKNIDEPKQMTLTFVPRWFDYSISLAGSGTASIDWGDGMPYETVTLSVANDDDELWEEKYTFSHNVVSFVDTPITIAIIGENITHLRCSNMRATSLEVS